ncbi:enolase C-terminal domain-like protein [Tribonema minus]|uniref:Enolase C-terminal domain-like protein n=1 Tax=Tribonema minus TaxID=303371 RepID=A0A835Z855_9STRA|nr:enolase C-terminal domain-like protein [Tribonema minus]
MTPITVPLTQPLALSRCTLTSREGVLLTLTLSRAGDSSSSGGSASGADGRSGGGSSGGGGSGGGGSGGGGSSGGGGVGSGGTYRGVSEVTPLPGFHKETLQQGQEQLQTLARALAGRQVPPLATALDGSIGRWLAAALGTGAAAALLPSVRCGVEMALLHALAAAADVPMAALIAAAALPARRCCGAVRMNSLLTRSPAQPVTTSRPLQHWSHVVKVKVGGACGPRADADRVNAIAARGDTRLRLDANQAWTLHEALAFTRELSPRARNAVEYIEEPLRDPRQLPRFSDATDGFPFALDESVTDGVGSVADLTDLRPTALVLKPTVMGGVEETVSWAQAAAHCGAAVVITSAFETGVCLSHLAILASALSSEGTCHGLSTFDRLSKEGEGRVWLPDFSEAVYDGDMIDVAVCQRLLDTCASRLV